MKAKPLGRSLPTHTRLFCGWAAVQMLIKLASWLMAIKLLKSLTFASDGQLCASMSLESVRRNLQRLLMAALAFSLSRRVQVTLTVPPPTKARARPICNKDNSIKQAFGIPSGLAWLRLRRGGGLGGAAGLMHRFSSWNGHDDDDLLNNCVPRLRQPKPRA